MTGSCQYGNCFHPDEDHDEGLCWKIVADELEKEQTTAKFCQCKQGDVERRYGHPKMGFAELGPNDLMITKKCSDCGKDVLLLPKETLCMFCKEKPGHYVPINIEEYVKTRLIMAPSGGVAIGIDNAKLQ